MITQETKSVKTWGGFNLTILKVNLNPLFWKNQSSYNKTYKPPRSTSYCYPPVELTDMTTCKFRIHGLLLSWILHQIQAHRRLCFFKLQWQQLDWSSRCRNFFLLENPKFMWRKTPQRSHKRFTQTANMSNIDFREVWVQNPKTKRGTLISLSLQCQKRGLRFPLYSGRSRSETLILNGLKLLFGRT